MFAKMNSFLGHVFILLTKSFSMLLSLFEGILDYSFLPPVVCLDGSEVSTTRKSTLGQTALH